MGAKIGLRTVYIITTRILFIMKIHPDIEILTASGTVYRCVGFSPNGTPVWHRNSEVKDIRLIAIRDELIPNLEATVSWGEEEGKLAGYNEQGGRTLRVVKGQVFKGMRLVSPNGHRSTSIVGMRS